MIHIILDASILGGFLLKEQQNEYMSNVMSLLKNHKAKVTVPALFCDEVINLLLKAVNQKRISSKAFDIELESLYIFLGIFNIAYYPTKQQEFQRRVALARKHNLRSYDAIYLDLAIEQPSKLATVDQRLQRAAEIEGCFFTL